MVSETIHLYNKRKFATYSFIIFIPAVIFTSIIVLGAKKTNKQEAYATETQEKKVKITVGQTPIDVILANTEDLREKGLSFRPSLPEKMGMLFVFDQKDIRPAFWMKDMSFSIDIIWINDGVITQINKNVPPEPGTAETELKLYPPNDLIDYVLEVNAGFSETSNLKVGDLVEIPF